MGQLEKDILRLELQMSELIRIAANLNERLKLFEDRNKHRSYTQKILVGHRHRIDEEDIYIR